MNVGKPALFPGGKMLCPYFHKTGVCRDQLTCQCLHIRPSTSPTILLRNLYQDPQTSLSYSRPFQSGRNAAASKEALATHFDNFYQNLFYECDNKYGKIEEMIVCENPMMHLRGNTLIKFYDEAAAEKALTDLCDVMYEGKYVKVELCPIVAFSKGVCDRGRNCSGSSTCCFIHVKELSESAKGALEKYKENRGSSRREEEQKLQQLHRKQSRFDSHDAFQEQKPQRKRSRFDDEKSEETKPSCSQTTRETVPGNSNDRTSSVAGGELLQRTVVLRNLYVPPNSSSTSDVASVPQVEVDKHFEAFYEEVYVMCDKTYGEIKEMNVCDYVGDIVLFGDVIIEFRRHEDARKAVLDLNNHTFRGRRIRAELRNNSNIRDSSCADFETGVCRKGRACRQLHLKKISWEFLSSMLKKIKSIDDRGPSKEEKTKCDVPSLVESETSQTENKAQQIKSSPPDRDGDPLTRGGSPGKKTVILRNLYVSPSSVTDPQVYNSQPYLSHDYLQRHFDEFYEEVFSQCESKFGPIEDMKVCCNVREDFFGNVIIKFKHAESAEKAAPDLNKLTFRDRKIVAELSADIGAEEGSCPQFNMGRCVEGEFCRYFHFLQISKQLKRYLSSRSGNERKSDRGWSSSQNSRFKMHDQVTGSQPLSQDQKCVSRSRMEQQDPGDANKHGPGEADQSQGQTVILHKLYIHPQISKLRGNAYLNASLIAKELQEHFDDFYEDVILECEEKYGQVDEMAVCDDVHAETSGNVIIKFHNKEDAQKAARDLNNRTFRGVRVRAEFSRNLEPKVDSCLLYHQQNRYCPRSPSCHLLHLMQLSGSMQYRLWVERRGRDKKKLTVSSKAAGSHEDKPSSKGNNENSITDTFLVATWYVEGCNNPEKQRDIDKCLIGENVDIACIQETNMATGNVKTDSYSWHFSGRKDATNLGVAVLVKHKLAQAVHNATVHSERFMCLEIEINKKRAVIITANIPCETDPDIPSSFAELNLLIKKVSDTKTPILLLGSFNAKIGKDDVTAEEQPYIGQNLQHDFCNSNAKLLKTMSTTFGLKVYTTFGDQSTLNSGCTGINKFSSQVHHILGTANQTNMIKSYGKFFDNITAKHKLICLLMKLEPSQTENKINPRDVKSATNTVDKPSSEKGDKKQSTSHGAKFKSRETGKNQGQNTRSIGGPDQGAERMYRNRGPHMARSRPETFLDANFQRKGQGSQESLPSQLAGLIPMAQENQQSLLGPVPNLMLQGQQGNELVVANLLAQLAMFGQSNVPNQTLGSLFGLNNPFM